MKKNIKAEIVGVSIFPSQIQMSQVAIHLTAVNANGEYLRDSGGDITESVNRKIDKFDYESKTLRWLLEEKVRFSDVLPAILPFSDMKIYKSMDDFTQNKSPLGLGEPINGLGRSETEAIVLVLPGTEVCCKLMTWDLIRKDYLI